MPSRRVLRCEADDDPCSASDWTPVALWVGDSPRSAFAPAGWLPAQRAARIDSMVVVGQ